MQGQELAKVRRPFFPPSPHTWKRHATSYCRLDGSSYELAVDILDVLQEIDESHIRFGCHGDDSGHGQQIVAMIWAELHVPYKIRDR